MNLASILVEELKCRHTTTFRSYLQRAGADVPDALSSMNGVDRSPIEIQREIELIPGPPPCLIHLRPTEQPQAFRIDQILDPSLVQNSFAAEMVASRKSAVLEDLISNFDDPFLFSCLDENEKKKIELAREICKLFKKK